MTTALAPILANATYDDVLEIVRLRSAAKDFRIVNQADHKARGVLHDRGDASWQDAVCSNHNALTRGIRRLGGMELDVFTIACAAVEEATVGSLAKDDLTAVEYALLVGPVGRSVAPWLLDGSAPPVIDPEAVKAASGPVAGNLAKVKVKKPVKASVARPPVEPIEVIAEEDLFGLDEMDEDPFGLTALDSLPDTLDAEPVKPVVKVRIGLFVRRR